MLQIQDFIQGRNLNYDTVRKYIKRNEKLFDGHIGKRNNIILDDYAVDLLEKKYPLPNPVEVIQDTESREQLIKAQQYIINLQRELQNKTIELNDYEVKQRLLEDSNCKLKEREEDLLNQIDYAVKEISTYKSKSESYEWKNELLEKRCESLEDKNEQLVEEKNKKIAELKDELEREKSKSWFAKLLGK